VRPPNNSLVRTRPKSGRAVQFKRYPLRYSKMKCIYCLQEKTSSCFKKTEHVLPQSFGKFKNNLTLNIKNDPRLKEVVCDECNDHFGKNLEISLGRDTFEGMVRFEHEVKKTHEFKSPGKKSRLKIKIDEGSCKGAFAYREYSEIDDKIVIKPIPQIGFKKRENDTTYEYFPLDEIPDKNFLENNFDLKAVKSIHVLGTDSETAKKYLSDKNIPFKPAGESYPSGNMDDLGCEVTGRIDQIIFRALAKIGFNYLTYWAGPEFVLRQSFNPIRRFIRFGEKGDYPFVIIIEKTILGDEPVVGKRRVGHLITLDRSKNKQSIVSQVSLFNLMTYSVLLAINYNRNDFLLQRGSFFNIADNEIYELTPGERITIGCTGFGPKSGPLQ